MKQRIEISNFLLERFIRDVRSRLPKKSFGYFVSDRPGGQPVDYVLFEQDDRLKESERFENFGEYYKNHLDAGFIATAEETWMVEQKLRKHNLYKVGMFHGHRRQPAIFSSVDKALHPSESLWHLILAVRNPEMPQIRVFKVREDKTYELEVTVLQSSFEAELLLNRWGNETLINESNLFKDLKNILKLNAVGEHIVTDNQLIYKALQLSEKLPKTMQEALLEERYKMGLEDRREHYKNEHMVHIDAHQWLSGCDEDNKYYYIGDSPRENVMLKSFYISKQLITQGDYFKFDSTYRVTNSLLPATDITWYDAYVYSKWMGLRLPSQYEWSYACSGGELYEWCCENEEDLIQYGWYSENSDQNIQEVNLLKPNDFGLYDMHGNVWEWCGDELDYTCEYSNKHTEEMKVCKGGSIFAFSEMCRNTFHYGEPTDYFATDLGFRVALDDN